MEHTALSIIRKVPLFAELREDALEALSRRCRVRMFGPHEAIFHQGDSGHCLYAIVSGHVSIQRVVSGETVRIALRGPGDAFGELSLIDGKPRMADAVTVDAAELLCLEGAALEWCREHHTAIDQCVLQYLAQRLRESADHLESLLRRSALERVSAAILDLMRVYGTDTAGEGRLIRAKVTLRLIGDRAGTRPETVCRALARLRRAGAVRFDQGVLCVTDEQKLAQFAGPSPADGRCRARA